MKPESWDMLMLCNECYVMKSKNKSINPRSNWSREDLVKVKNITLTVLVNHHCWGSTWRRRTKDMGDQNVETQHVSWADHKSVSSLSLSCSKICSSTTHKVQTQSKPDPECISAHREKTSQFTDKVTRAVKQAWAREQYFISWVILCFLYI